MGLTHAQAAECDAERELAVKTGDLLPKLVLLSSGRVLPKLALPNGGRKEAISFQIPGNRHPHSQAHLGICFFFFLSGAPRFEKESGGLVVGNITPNTYPRNLHPHQVLLLPTQILVGAEYPMSTSAHVDRSLPKIPYAVSNVFLIESDR